MIHCLEIRKQWARQRLVPTSICALLALGHFHSVIWTNAAAYPLSNVFPCIVESFLLGGILLTILLNLMTQLVLEGEITRPLFGHTRTLMPKWDEDFGVVLIRLGAASLEATSVAGLGNEVAAVSSTNTAVSLRRDGGSHQGFLELDRAGVVSMTWPDDHGRKRGGNRRGFANEITQVKVHSLTIDTWMDSMVHLRWYKELWKFLVAIWVALRGLLRGVWSCVRGIRRTSTTPIEREISDSGDLRGDDEGEERDIIYEKFLLGDTLSDDDEDFDPSSDSRFPPGSPTSTSDGEISDEDGPDSGETVQLYADLSTDTTASSSAPLLLAHMVNTSTSPLTRLRYRKLVHVPDDQHESDDWQAFVQSRREAKSSATAPDGLDEVRRNCVICTVEPREIICWPCRCLALCNDCRENLASRSAASKHTCPCCRTSVQGYSRIYIP